MEESIGGRSTREILRLRCATPRRSAAEPRRMASTFGRSRPHRLGFDPVPPAPFAVGERRDLARLDLAAAAPEHVGVAHGDADGSEVLVDRLLVGEDAFLLR